MDSGPLEAGTHAAIHPRMNETFDSLAKTLIHAVEHGASRRTSPRIDLHAEVDLTSETNFFSGFSTDIALGGLFIATLDPLKVGVEVAMKFTLPGGAEVQATGEVRWVRAFNEQAQDMLPGMGIQFVDLSPKAQAAIAAFIREREPMFFPD